MAPEAVSTSPQIKPDAIVDTSPARVLTNIVALLPQLCMSLQVRTGGRVGGWAREAAVHVR